MIPALGLGALAVALALHFPSSAFGKKKKKSKGSAYTCDIESVRKAADKAGKKGIMKALGLKEHRGGPDCGCDCEDLVITAWMVGHFTQKECAEVIVFYRYEYACEGSEGPYKAAFLGLKGNKIKSKMKGIYTTLEEIGDFKKRDIDKNGIDETIISTFSGVMEYGGHGYSDEPLSKKYHLIKWAGKKPVKLLVLDVLWDDTDLKSNPPYIVRTFKPVFKDVNGDGVEEVMVYGYTAKYADRDHEKLISKKDEPMKAYFFNGKVYVESSAAGVGTAAEGSAANTKKAAKTAYNKGQAKFEAGDYPGALAGFKKALDILSNPFVYIKIAGCYEKMQDYKGAAKWLQKYVQEKPGAGNIADIKGRIKKLLAGQPSSHADNPTMKKAVATFPSILFGEWSIQTLDDEVSAGAVVVISHKIAFKPGGDVILEVTFEDLWSDEKETAITKRKWKYKDGAFYLHNEKCLVLEKKPKKMKADSIDAYCAIFVVSENEILWWHEEAGPVRMLLEKLTRLK